MGWSLDTGAYLGRSNTMGTINAHALSLLNALSLLAFVGYFAGVFHLVRLFNAHRAVLTRWEPERGLLHTRFSAMESRVLFWMAWPALILLLLTGALLIWQRPALLKEPFVQVGLGLMAVLFAYHLLVHRVQRRLQNAALDWSGARLWLFGQGSTMLLIALICTIAFKDQFGWVWGALGLLLLGGLIGYAIIAARGERKPEQDA